jgi:rubrerythrin
LYFAKISRAAGDEATARVFEETAAQEVQHAFGHLDLLYPAAELTPAKALEFAIAGETYEYTEMYPQFRHLAEQEGNHRAVAELDEQIEESKEHAQRFRDTLAKAAKRFAALARVEERHANQYKAALAKATA